MSTLISSWNISFSVLIYCEPLKLSLVSMLSLPSGRSGFLKESRLDEPGVLLFNSYLFSLTGVRFCSSGYAFKSVGVGIAAIFIFKGFSGD